MKINAEPDCPNKNCLGGVITYDGSSGSICKKCNPYWSESCIKIYEGKVVLLPLFEVKEGDWVYWDGCPSRVKIWYVRYDDNDQNKSITISPNIASPRAQSPYLKEVKQLAVEYSVGNEVVYTPITTFQWKKIVNEDIIGKEVNFTIVDRSSDTPYENITIDGCAHLLNDRALKFIKMYGSIKYRIDQLREEKGKITNKIDDLVKTVFDDYGFEHTLGTWDCPSSPIGYCIYNHFEDPALDDCLFCHNPDERK